LGYVLSLCDVLDYRRRRYRNVLPKDEAFASGFVIELKNKLLIGAFGIISQDKFYHQILRNLTGK